MDPISLSKSSPLQEDRVDHISQSVDQSIDQPGNLAGECGRGVALRCEYIVPRMLLNRSTIICTFRCRDKIAFGKPITVCEKEMEMEMEMETDGFLSLVDPVSSSVIITAVIWMDGLADVSGDLDSTSILKRG